MIFQNKGICKVGLQCIAKGKRNMALDMYRVFRQATDMKDYSMQLKSVRRQLVSEKSTGRAGKSHIWSEALINQSRR